MATVLVTGGNGFIGSHTCISLLNKGYDVLILDSLVNSYFSVLEKIKIINRKNKTKVKFVKGDLRDISIIERVFQETKDKGEEIESVIHFAGLKAVSESVLIPLEYWEVNLVGTINLLKVMEKNNCYNLVFSSSASIYGATKLNQVSEKAEINPMNPYANTKAVIEKLLWDIFSKSKKNWKIMSLRYFNPIGAHSSGLIGESAKGKPNNLFPIILKVASGFEKRLRIFGRDWDTIDGSGVRDYIHVMDVADGHCKALDYLLSNPPQISFLNIGTGIGTSVIQLKDIFEKVNSCKIPFSYEKRRTGDVGCIIADNKLSIDKLKWQPKRDIEDMCRDGWKYFCLNNKINF